MFHIARTSRKPNLVPSRLFLRVLSLGVNPEDYKATSCGVLYLLKTQMNTEIRYLFVASYPSISNVLSVYMG